MGTQWGNWEYSGGNGMRVGIDVSTSAVSSSSSSVTFTYKIYTDNQYRYDDDQVLDYDGVLSGSTSFANNDSGSAVLRSTRTYTYNYGSTSYGSSPGSVTAAADVTGTYNGVTPAKSVTTTIPARPYAGPSAPTIGTAYRSNDASGKITWSRNVTSQRPYTSVTVQRMTYSGSVWSGWVTIGTASGSATSLALSGLSANHAYRFQVRANNSVGSSSWSGLSNIIYMSPAAPSTATAALQAGGASIRVAWKNNHYGSYTNSLTVERSVAGGAYASVATGLSYTTTAWVDPSPGAGTNTYRVKAVQFTGPISSGYATTNTVTTIVPPLAPTSLAPNGIKLDFTLPFTLTWTHNPGGDGAPQSAFFIDYSTNGGTSWLALNGAGTSSAASSYTVPANTLVNGTTYLWRVRTVGISSAGQSPNSANATLTGSAAPSVAITAPATTTVALPMVVAWTYSQAQGSAQGSWTADLFAADGLTLLESKTGTGTATTTSFAYPVQNGTAYVVKVAVVSAAGIKSITASKATTVSLPPPAQATVATFFDPCTGTVTLSVAGLAPAAGEAAISSVTIERRVEGASDWVTLGTGVTLPTDFVDIIPLTNGSNEYRVTVLSAAPSYRVLPSVFVEGTDGQGDLTARDGLWVLLAYGDAFRNVLRFHGDPDLSETSGRVRAAQSFLGRRKPVLLVGGNTNREISVAGSLVWDNACNDPNDCRFDSPSQEWLTAARDAEIVCYRDYTGRRVFGMLSDIDSDNTRVGYGTLSFKVVETDFVEVYA